MVDVSEYIEPSIGAVSIKDGLFIGDATSATDVHWMGLNKVTHVINCAGGEVEATTNPLAFSLTYAWRDCDDEVILDARDLVVREVIDFMAGPEKEGESVLIYSKLGFTRNITLVVAYMMVRHSWTYSKAWAYILRRCSNVSLPPLRRNLANQLRSLETRIHLLSQREPSQTWSCVRSDFPGISDQDWEMELTLRNSHLNARTQTTDQILLEEAHAFRERNMAKNVCLHCGTWTAQWSGVGSKFECPCRKCADCESKPPHTHTQSVVKKTRRISFNPMVEENFEGNISYAPLNEGEQEDHEQGFNVDEAKLDDDDSNKSDHNPPVDDDSTSIYTVQSTAVGLNTKTSVDRPIDLERLTENFASSNTVVGEATLQGKAKQVVETMAHTESVTARSTAALEEQAHVATLTSAQIGKPTSDETIKEPSQTTKTPIIEHKEHRHRSVSHHVEQESRNRFTALFKSSILNDAIEQRESRANEEQLSVAGASLQKAVEERMSRLGMFMEQNKFQSLQRMNQANAALETNTKPTTSNSLTAPSASTASQTRNDSQRRQSQSTQNIENNTPHPYTISNIVSTASDGPQTVFSRNPSSVPRASNSRSTPDKFIPSASIIRTAVESARTASEFAHADVNRASTDKGFIQNSTPRTREYIASSDPPPVPVITAKTHPTLAAPHPSLISTRVPLNTASKPDQPVRATTSVSSTSSRHNRPPSPCLSLPQRRTTLNPDKRLGTQTQSQNQSQPQAMIPRMYLQQIPQQPQYAPSSLSNLTSISSVRPSYTQTHSDITSSRLQQQHHQQNNYQNLYNRTDDRPLLIPRSESYKIPSHASTNASSGSNPISSFQNNTKPMLHTNIYPNYQTLQQHHQRQPSLRPAIAEPPTRRIIPNNTINTDSSYKPEYNRPVSNVHTSSRPSSPVVRLNPSFYRPNSPIVSTRAASPSIHDVPSFVRASGERVHPATNVGLITRTSGM